MPHKTRSQTKILQDKRREAARLSYQKRREQKQRELKNVLTDSKGQTLPIIEEILIRQRAAAAATKEREEVLQKKRQIVMDLLTVHNERLDLYNLQGITYEEHMRKYKEILTVLNTLIPDGTTVPAQLIRTLNAQKIKTTRGPYTVWLEYNHTKRWKEEEDPDWEELFKGPQGADLAKLIG